MSDLTDLSRADLVQTAKAEGVKASGTSEEIVARIQAKRAEAPAPASVDGANPMPGESPSLDDPAETFARLTEAAARKRGDALPITRRNDIGWWCPSCDNSQVHALTECAGCGARRDGDEVVFP